MRSFQGWKLCNYALVEVNEILFGVEMYTNTSNKHVKFYIMIPSCFRKIG